MFLSKFMYDHTLHCGRKNFCRYCWKAFNTGNIFKRHIKHCFTTNGKQRIKVPEDNEKQNQDQCYTNKYQKHVACSYGFDKFDMPYFGKDGVYNYINGMIEESKNRTDIMKKTFQQRTCDD